MRRNVGAVLATLSLLLLAACGDTAADPTAAVTATASASPEATASPEPSATATAEPTASPDDGETGLAECFSEPMPDIDTGWTFLQDMDGTFGLMYPDHWEDLSGEVDFATASLLHEETVAELGVDGDATINANFVREPTGIPNLSVFYFGAVDSTTEEIYEREAERYADFPSVERIVETSLEACVGGALAHGLSMEFTSSDGLTYYQQNLVAVRNGELYVVQWLDETDDPDTDLLAEILTTWGWMLDSLGPDGSGGIAGASMATEVDESRELPDPSTYTNSFATDAPGIYIVYILDGGTAGTVSITWLFEGDVQYEGTLDVLADTTWAWGGISPPGGGFEPGSYEVHLELNGDEEIVEFTVED